MPKFEEIVAKLERAANTTVILGDLRAATQLYKALMETAAAAFMLANSGILVHGAEESAEAVQLFEKLDALEKIVK